MAAYRETLEKISKDIEHEGCSKAFAESYAALINTYYTNRGNELEPGLRVALNVITELWQGGNDNDER